MSSVPLSLPSFLLDVNALIALGVRQHQFHLRVSRWVETAPFSHLLTCPTTELGFLRILAQTPAYSATVTRAKEQLTQLKANTKYSIRFLPDDQDVSGLPAWVRTGGQTTDGHLIQLAQAHGAMLATLDQRIPGAFVIPQI